jgi:hypothetical protein
MTVATFTPHVPTPATIPVAMIHPLRTALAVWHPSKAKALTNITAEPLLDDIPQVLAGSRAARGAGWDTC